MEEVLGMSAVECRGLTFDPGKQFFEMWRNQSSCQAVRKSHGQEIWVYISSSKEHHHSLSPHHPRPEQREKVYPEILARTEESPIQEDMHIQNPRLFGLKGTVFLYLAWRGLFFLIKILHPYLQGRKIHYHSNLWLLPNVLRRGPSLTLLSQGIVLEGTEMLLGRNSPGDEVWVERLSESSCPHSPAAGLAERRHQHMSVDWSDESDSEWEAVNASWPGCVHVLSTGLQWLWAPLSQGSQRPGGRLTAWRFAASSNSDPSLDSEAKTDPGCAVCLVAQEHKDECQDQRRVGVGLSLSLEKSGERVQSRSKAGVSSRGRWLYDIIPSGFCSQGPSLDCPTGNPQELYGRRALLLALGLESVLFRLLFSFGMAWSILRCDV